MDFVRWLERWSQYLPPQAHAELSQIILPHGVPSSFDDGRSEAAVQSEGIVLASAEFGTPLWRNNNGAAMMIDPKRPQEPPRHVRFGLGNTSKKVNAGWKSSDTVGIRPTFITPELLGATLGVFTAIETKKPGWTLRRGDAHGQAQNNFICAVQRFGGRAGFAQSPDDFRRILG